MRNSIPIRNLEEYMFIKQYSKNTVDNYISCIKNVLKNSNKDVYHLTVDDFNNYIIKSNKSSSFNNLVVSSGKLFFYYGLKRKSNNKFLHRPKKSKKIIEILTQKEVWSIIDSINNIKQKSIISGIYLHGLRISEVLNLKYENIDRHRKLLTIREAKGKKDRLVPLNKFWLEHLEVYAKKMNHKKGYNEPIFTPYSLSSIRSTLKKYAKKVGIRKKIYPHLLRDTYASHLLQSGFDISLIQEILGHSKIYTTRKYIHFSAVNISAVCLKKVI